MSKFKPGDIVYYMDGNVLRQAVVCVGDDTWPVVPDGFCYVYNISPQYGEVGCTDGSRRCTMVETRNLYLNTNRLISAIKSSLKKEYDKKVQVLDTYNKGSTEKKKSLANTVHDILLGRDVDDTEL